MEKFVRFVLDRLKEGSTWRGLVMLLTSVGVGLNPEQITAIITAGTAVVGVIGVFWPEKKD